MSEFFGCTIGGLLVGNKILEDVNARLPAGERFFWLGWYPGKQLRLWQEYIRLGLPRRPLVWQAGLGLGAAICLWLFAWMVSGMIGP